MQDKDVETENRRPTREDRRQDTEYRMWGREFDIDFVLQQI